MTTRCFRLLPEARPSWGRTPRKRAFSTNDRKSPNCRSGTCRPPEADGPASRYASGAKRHRGDEKP